MTPSDLAAKIAEEVFRTIERERGIVKAEIADGIEKVIAKEMPEFLRHRGKTWGLWADCGLPTPGEVVRGAGLTETMQRKAQSQLGYGPSMLGSVGNAGMADLSKQGLNQGLGSQYWQGRK